MPTINLTETAADVAALIPKYSWELMDEEQRDTLMEQIVLPRYMQTTSDGVKLTPKFWAAAVGASPAAIKNRVLRLKTKAFSDSDSVARAHWTAGARERRNAKAVLREATPEQVEALVDSLPPERQEEIAVAASPERRRARAFAQGRKPAAPQAAPELAMANLARELAKARTALRNGLDLVISVNQAGDDEDLLADFDRIISLAEAVKDAYITGQSVDTWAADLAAE